MLIISTLFKRAANRGECGDRQQIAGPYGKPALARRFQQIAVAIFHTEVEEAGYDLTPVQYAALTTIGTRPELIRRPLQG